MEKQVFDCFGEKLTLEEICTKYSMSRTTLNRKRKTMSIEEAIRSCRNVENDPCSMKGINMRQVERENGLTPGTLGRFMRRNKGMSLEEGIKTLHSKMKIHHDKTYTNEKGEQEQISIRTFAKKFQVGENTVYRYLRNGYTLDAAREMIRANQDTLYDYNNQKLPLTKIAELSGASIEYLRRMAKRDEHFKDNIEIYTEQGRERRKITMYDENMTLRQYCIENGYNYRVIASKIENGMSMEDAIEEYLMYGQNDPTSSKYEYHGILLSSLLLHYHVDARSVINMINDGTPLLDAISITIFKTGKHDNQVTAKKMYDIYQKMNSLPDREKYQYLSSQLLDEEEKQIFEQKYNRLGIIRRDLSLIAFYVEHKNDDSNFMEESLSEVELKYIKDLVSRLSTAKCTRVKEAGKVKDVQYYQKTFEKANIG